MAESDYVKFLEGNPSRVLRCAYCGEEVKAYDSEAICQFCGMPANLADEELKTESNVYDLLLKMQEALRNGNYASVISYSEEMLNSEKNAENYFSAGIFCSAASDYLYSKVDYNIYGYMEDNAANKAKAKEFTTKAKQYFYAALKMCDSSPSNNFEYTYLKFVIQLKMKRFADAKKSLDAVNKSNGTKLAKDYANLAFYVEDGMLNDAKAYLKKMPKYKDVAISYYVAKLNAKSGNIGQAKRMLEKIVNSVQMPKAQKLLGEIEQLNI